MCKLSSIIILFRYIIRLLCQKLNLYKNSFTERKNMQRSSLVPFKHHSRQQAASASRHRRRPAAKDCGEPHQGRLPDTEGGRVGRLQSKHKWN